jgi:uncharacterized protein (DUF1499 family)
MTLWNAGIGAIMLVTATLAVFGAVGPERVWELFGPPDLGPVAFETLQRRPVPNDALACPAELCRARSDLSPPVFAVSAEALEEAMARVIASEPDVTPVERRPLSERYIQRTRWLRFPDTVVIRYIPLGERRSTLALYSRSQLGRGDLGVNKARLARWLAKLSAEAPLAQ